MTPSTALLQKRRDGLMRKIAPVAMTANQIPNGKVAVVLQMRRSNTKCRRDAAVTEQATRLRTINWMRRLMMSVWKIRSYASLNLRGGKPAPAVCFCL